MKILLVLVAWSTVALAQPAPGAPANQRAEALFAQGTRHYDLREYDQAIAVFTEGYRLVGEPLFLFNIAQAYRLKGDCDNALGFYKNYLRNVTGAADRAKVEARIAEMDTCVQQRRAIAAASNPVEPPPIEPPPVVVAHPVVVPPSASEITPSVTLPASPPRPRRTRSARWVGLGLGGAGVGAAIVGGVFSARASAAAREIERRCATGCTTLAIADLDQRGRSAERTATLLYVGGGAAAALGAGLVLWTVLGPATEPITITPSRGGAIASTRVRF